MSMSTKDKWNHRSLILNATDLWQIENSLPSIPTFSQSLDHVLGTDGIQLRSLTEVLGLPGSGKTQLCLQLCASIQVPRALGGLSSEALYIDTNTNFTVCRFKEILTASLQRCRQLLDLPLPFDIDDALKKLHYTNAFGLETFCSFMQRLPMFVKERPNIKLIVIDSIAFPFKEGIDPRKRTGLLFRMMAELQRLTTQRHIAVVLTNEMSTRVGLTSSSTVVGGMGDAWAHRCDTRVLLSAPGDRPLASTPARRAVVLKAASGGGVANFQAAFLNSPGLQNRQQDGEHIFLCDKNGMLKLHWVEFRNAAECD